MRRIALYLALATASVCTAQISTSNASSIGGKRVASPLTCTAGQSLVFDGTKFDCVTAPSNLTCTASAGSCGPINVSALGLTSVDPAVISCKYGTGPYTRLDWTSFTATTSSGKIATVTISVPVQANTVCSVNVGGGVGPQGPQGVAGPAGSAGPAGPAGPIGPQGIPGTVDATGQLIITGPTGVPSFTKDYDAAQTNFRLHVMPGNLSQSWCEVEPTSPPATVNSVVQATSISNGTCGPLDSDGTMFAGLVVVKQWTTGATNAITSWTRMPSAWTSVTATSWSAL